MIVLPLCNGVPDFIRPSRHVLRDASGRPRRRLGRHGVWSSGLGRISVLLTSQGDTLDPGPASTPWPRLTTLPIARPQSGLTEADTDCRGAPAVGSCPASLGDTLDPRLAPRHLPLSTLVYTSTSADCRLDLLSLRCYPALLR